MSYAVEEVLRDVDAHIAVRSATEDKATRKVSDDARKQVMKIIRYIRDGNGMATVTRIAAQLCTDDEFEQKLDCHPHLIGVKNGVVDLRTGVLRKRVPELSLIHI